MEMKLVDRMSYRRWLAFAHDVTWVPIAIIAAYWVRYNLSHIPAGAWRAMLGLITVAVPVYALFFRLFDCHRGMWRFAAIPDLLRLAKAVLLGTITSLIACFMISRLNDIPRSVMVLYPIFLLGAVTSMRLTYRLARDRDLGQNVHKGARALLVGAGRSGELLIRDLERNPAFKPVAFVDDDVVKLGHEVRGVRVRGAIQDIPRLIEELRIETVLITMPSVSRRILDQVVEICAISSVQCRTLPSLAELADGRVEVSRLRPVTVEDLLGREPVQLDETSIASFLSGKRILVTGGGGSIGSELCRQIGKHNPANLVVMDNSEYNLYRIDQELASTCGAHIYNSVLGDVRDVAAVESLFAQFKPEVVFHAAAYKHVPMVEDNVIEGIRNNVFGTKMIADAAKRNGTATFVLISTDKTVNPTNVMGTTKRVAELYCQALNESGGTHFITTRFGNVLGSAGSVVPLFERQIAAGGPVTVTHPDITRYFMTIPEASSLILQAGAIGKGGEIFVLDMGEPIRIGDLAEKLIQLSGFQPGRDIKIEYVGLRPGEKLHEELFYERELLQYTVHPKVMLASYCKSEKADIDAGLERLVRATLNYDEDQALIDLKLLVPEFKHSIVPGDSSSEKAKSRLKLVR